MSPRIVIALLVCVEFAACGSPEPFHALRAGASGHAGVVGTPAGWLVRIARNRAIDRLRANQVRDRTVEAMSPASAPPVENAETHAVRNEEQRAVQRALAALPPQQRELIERAYFKGSTQSELAAQFNLPLATVNTFIRTGLLALRACLQERLIER